MYEAYCAPLKRWVLAQHGVFVFGTMPRLSAQGPAGRYSKCSAVRYYSVIFHCYVLSCAVRPLGRAKKGCNHDWLHINIKIEYTKRRFFHGFYQAFSSLGDPERHLTLIFPYFFLFVVCAIKIFQAMACEPGPWMLDLVDPALEKAGGLVVATGANSPQREKDQDAGGQPPSAANGEIAAAAAAAPAAEENEERALVGADKNARRTLTVIDGEGGGALAAATKRRPGVRVEGGAAEREEDTHAARGGVEGENELPQADGEQRDDLREEVPKSEHDASGGVHQPPEIDIHLVDGANVETTTGGNEERGGRGEEEGGGDVVGDEQGSAADADPAAASCDSAFPLAATLVAWASLFSVPAAYSMYPPGKDRNGGGRVTSESGSETV